MLFYQKCYYFLIKFYKIHLKNKKIEEQITKFKDSLFVINAKKSIQLFNL